MERVCYEVQVVRQVSSAPDWGGVSVAIVTRDVTAGGAQFTCRCLLERRSRVRALLRRMGGGRGDRVEARLQPADE